MSYTSQQKELIETWLRAVLKGTYVSFDWRYLYENSTERYNLTIVMIKLKDGEELTDEQKNIINSVIKAQINKDEDESDVIYIENIESIDVEKILGIENLTKVKQGDNTAPAPTPAPTPAPAPAPTPAPVTYAKNVSQESVSTNNYEEEMQFFKQYSEYKFQCPRLIFKAIAQQYLDRWSFSRSEESRQKESRQLAEEMVRFFERNQDLTVLDMLELESIMSPYMHDDDNKTAIFYNYKVRMQGGTDSRSLHTLYDKLKRSFIIDLTDYEKMTEWNYKTGKFDDELPDYSDNTKKTEEDLVVRYRNFCQQPNNPYTAALAIKKAIQLYLETATRWWSFPSQESLAFANEIIKEKNPNTILSRYHTYQREAKDADSTLVNILQKLPEAVKNCPEANSDDSKSASTSRTPMGSGF